MYFITKTVKWYHRGPSYMMYALLVMLLRKKKWARQMLLYNILFKC